MQSHRPSSSEPYPEYMAVHQTRPSTVQRKHLSLHSFSLSLSRTHLKYVLKVPDNRVFRAAVQKSPAWPLPYTPHPLWISCWQSDKSPLTQRL